MEEGGAGARFLLLKTITQTEYDGIEVSVRGKIEGVLHEHIENYLAAKASFVTTKETQERRISDLEENLKLAVQERDDFRIKLDSLTTQYDDTVKRLNLTSAQLNKVRDELVAMEKSVEKARNERDAAVDARQVADSVLERREAEVERLQAYTASLNADLRAAINAKCEAVSLADDVQAKQIELEFKEKRFESERSLLSQQIVELTADLSRTNDDLARQRRESTTTNITLQTKISEKEEELRIMTEKMRKLTDHSNELETQLDTMSDKLKRREDEENQLRESFQQEIKSQTKLVELYKERLEEAEHKSGELSAAVKELQGLLQEASSQCGDLETRLMQQETDGAAVLETKQEAISALKEELRHANILLEAVKQESSEAAVSRLSPMAASASKLLKSGLTLTQLYTKYAETMQDLVLAQSENESLKSYVEQILKDVEERAPALQKQRDDYNYAVSSMEALTQKVDDLENEHAKLVRANTEAEATASYLGRENKRLHASVKDLSRQVCLLLREVEAARGNHLPLVDTPETKKADLVTTADVISEHLVTFRDVEELQLNNQKLLVAIRELSEDRDQVEMGRESEKIASLQAEIERAQATISDYIERENFHLKEIEVIKKQRDIHQRLYKQQLKPGMQPILPEDVEMSTELGSPKNTSVASTTVTDASLKALMEDIKKEYETYREDRKNNEKILMETINDLRTQLSTTIRLKSEINARAEFNEEKVQALAAKVKSQGLEVDSLEKRCQNYVNTIGKLEYSIQQLRNDAMTAMSKLSVAEVSLANAQQENQMLKDNERRMQKEREAERKGKHGQELLMANLEALKAKFECTEADAKMRLENRLDEANAECVALRRRLQEEQDRLVRRVEMLEEQTRTAKARLEEEKALRAKAIEDLESARNEVREKELKIDEMQEQLTTAINRSQPVLDRENKIKELEGVIREKERALNGVKEQLLASKKCQAELSEVSQGIEKQLTDLTDQYELLKQESDKTIEELRKTELELRSTVRSLEVKLRTSDAAETESRAQRDAELASLRSRVETLTAELENSKGSVVILERDAKEAVRQAQAAEEKATIQILASDSIRTELDTVKSLLSETTGNLTVMKNNYDRIFETSEMEKKAFTDKIAVLEARLKESDEKIAELTRINDMLQDQVQELGTKVSLVDTARASGTDFEADLSSETSRDSDRLLQVLRFLRKEKSSAIAAAHSLRSEKLRIEAEMEVLRRQLSDTRKSLDEARSSSEPQPIAAERHAQLLNKVETLNQLTEVNKSLREDRDRLFNRLTAVEQELSAVQANVISPIRKKLVDMEARVEQLNTENAGLKADNQRWRDRTNDLIEKHNKNPDELKRLIAERDHLAKQLTTEREQTRLFRTKLEEQVAALKRDKEEMTAGKNLLEKTLIETRQELAALREAEARFTKKITELETERSNSNTLLEHCRSKEIQLKQLAKKYKSQCQELSKNLEEKNEAGPSPLALEQAEERVKRVNEQLTALETENEALRRENDTLKGSVGEREDRAKNLLKNARSRVQFLTEENKTLSKELAEARRSKGESSSTDSSLESRLSRLEKEKGEEVAEKERLGRELEVMTQKIAIMQRQLEKHGAKPSTSSGDKSSSDPPTANIKPLSGPTTSSTKQTQPQPVTVMPWRETPFASIRPMSQQTRTVVVLPTSQTTSTSSQPVLVAPQQQVVHTSSTCEGLSSSPTSSHMDYMPATSSAVHNLHAPGLSVIIGQHMEAEAGADDAVPAAPAHCVQPNPNVSIALVLPQPAQQQQDSQQVEQVENTGVVSASNQEQLSEQSVSASNHATSGIMSGPYYRSVDESSGPVASSQTEGSVSGVSVPGCSIAASSQQAASSTTSVTTSVAPAVKRPNLSEDLDTKHLPPSKRCRLGVGEGTSEMLLRSDGLEVEYQVPTSSQRDQEDDIVVLSDDDDLPDDGVIEDGPEFEEETEDEGRYGLEGYSRDGQDMALTSYEEAEGPDIDEGSTTDQDNNEVDIIEDSNEVPNQCEPTRSVGIASSASSSGGAVDVSATTGGEATSSLGSTTSSLDFQSRRVRQPHHMVLQYEDPQDDSIVPSTPTLFVPRRTDGFGEAVSSPHVPSARFTFADQGTRVPVAGVAQVASEGMDDTRMDLSQLDEGTGRSVPTTPSHVSPQDPLGPEIGQSSSQDLVIPGGSGGNDVSVPETPMEAQVAGNLDDNGDGVSSEGEKSTVPPSSLVQSLSSASDQVPDLVEAEGREAEASHPTAPASSSRGGMARRSVRLHHHRVTTRSNAPTPIIWTRQPPTVTMQPIRARMWIGPEEADDDPRNTGSAFGPNEKIPPLIDPYLSSLPQQSGHPRMRISGSDRPNPGRGRPRRSRGNFGPRF